MVCTVNTFTSFYSSIVIFSILGFMAHEKGVEIQDVVKSGPGLAFLVFPEVVLQLTPSAFWDRQKEKFNAVLKFEISQLYIMYLPIYHYLLATYKNEIYKILL